MKISFMILINVPNIRITAALRTETVRHNRYINHQSIKFPLVTVTADISSSANSGLIINIKYNNDTSVQEKDD